MNFLDLLHNSHALARNPQVIPPLSRPLSSRQKCPQLSSETTRQECSSRGLSCGVTFRRLARERGSGGREREIARVCVSAGAFVCERESETKKEEGTARTRRRLLDGGGGGAGGVGELGWRQRRPQRARRVRGCSYGSAARPNTTRKCIFQQDGEAGWLASESLFLFSSPLI